MKLPVEAISVGERARKDMGDLAPLVDSIRELGLLHPIVVTDSHELVAGGRRLEAVRQLGWTEVPVSVLPMSPEEMLQAERDENTARLDLRRSEMVALGRRLEEVLQARVLENRRAAAAMARAVKSGAVKTPTPAGKPVRQVRDAVGRAMGVAGRTYECAKQVVEAAEADPDTFGDLVEKMDDTGNVYGTHREMEERKRGSEASPAPRFTKPERLEQIQALTATGHTAAQIAAELGVSRAYVMNLANKHGVELVDKKIGKRRQINPNEVAEKTVVSLEGSAQIVGIIEAHFDELDRGQFAEWAESMNESIRALRALARRFQREAVQ